MDEVGDISAEEHDGDEDNNAEEENHGEEDDSLVMTDGVNPSALDWQSCSSMSHAVALGVSISEVRWRKGGDLTFAFPPATSNSTTKTTTHGTDVQSRMQARPFARADIARVLRGRKVLLVGNSNIRYLFESVFDVAHHIKTNFTNLDPKDALRYTENNDTNYNSAGNLINATKNLKHNAFWVRMPLGRTSGEGDFKGDHIAHVCPVEKGAVKYFERHVVKGSPELTCDILEMEGVRDGGFPDDLLIAFQWTSTPQAVVLKEIFDLMRHNSRREDFVYIADDADVILVQLNQVRGEWGSGGGEGGQQTGGGTGGGS